MFELFLIVAFIVQITAVVVLGREILKEETEGKEEKFTPYSRVRDVASELARMNTGKKVPVAQVSEILKHLNQLTNGEFYKFLKGK